MKYEYARVDLIKLIPYGIDIKWMYSANDSEYREDYCCFFVLKGSRTYTLVSLKYGDVFD
jgi:hypothetical protein